MNNPRVPFSLTHSEYYFKDYWAVGGGREREDARDTATCVVMDLLTIRDAALVEVYIYICVYMNIYACIYTCVVMDFLIFRDAALVEVHVYACFYRNIYICIDTCVVMDLLTFRDAALVEVYTYMFIYKHTYICIYIYAYI